MGGHDWGDRGMTKEDENIKIVQTDSKRETLTTKRNHKLTKNPGSWQDFKVHKFMESTYWTNCIKDAATFIFFKSSLKDKIHLRYLSTAIATSVKTEADTEMPWTMPLILQTKLPKGHPVDKRDALSWFTTETTNCDSWHDDCSPRLWLSCNGILLGHRRNHQFL